MWSKKKLETPKAAALEPKNLLTNEKSTIRCVHRMWRRTARLGG
jgi:hypothetical protein